MREHETDQDDKDDGGKHPLHALGDDDGDLTALRDEVESEHQVNGHDDGEDGNIAGEMVYSDRQASSVI